MRLHLRTSGGVFNIDGVGLPRAAFQDFDLQISINIQGLDELVSKVAEFSESALELVQGAMLDSATENIVAVAKSLAPRRTGALADSIEAQAGGQGEILIVADKSYAAFMEYGTQPHIIEAKNASALHWTKDGQDFFAKSVQHPGTKPRPFIQPGIDQGLEALKEDIMAIFQKELT